MRCTKYLNTYFTSLFFFYSCSEMSNDHPIFGYFDYDQNTDKSKCNIDGCNFPFLKGKHANNLCKHVERKHREVAGG